MGQGWNLEVHHKKDLRKMKWIESWYHQTTIIKSHIGGCPTKLANVTFNDPEKSRPLSEILDAEYLTNSVRWFVSTEDHNKFA